MSEGSGATPKEEEACKPVLNDLEAGEAAKRTVREDTGGAIDADAAHERSS